MTRVWVNPRFSGHGCHGFGYGLKPEQTATLTRQLRVFHGYCISFFCFSCLTVSDTPCHPLPQHNDDACTHTHAHPHPCLPPSNAICIFFLFFLCLTVTPTPPPPSTQHNACTPMPMPAALKCGMSVFFSCFSCLTATPPSIPRQNTHTRTHPHPPTH